MPVQSRTLTCLDQPRSTARPTIALRRAAGGDRPAWVTRTAPPRGVDVSASGPGAAGLDLFDAVVADRSAGGGLAVQHCAEPSRRWWFVGAGSTSARSGTIVLRAPDDAEAVVDVVLRGPEGVLDTVGTQDIRVEAGGAVTLPLADLVAGTDDVAVDIEASSGQVVAGVTEALRDGSSPAGTQWLPATVEPARTLLVPGAGGAGDDRRAPARLLLATQQDRSVVTRPVLLTSTGRVIVPGLESVRVPAGAVAAVDLPRDFGAGATIELRASAPVTAAVRQTTGSDVATASAAPPLQGPAVLPVDLGADVDVDLAGALTLSALLVDPDSQVVRTRSLRLRGFGDDGTVVGTGAVDLDAGTSRSVALARVLGLRGPDRADLAYVLVRPQPEGGDTVPVVASLSLTSADGAAVLPVTALASTVTVPALVPTVVPTVVP